MVSGFTILVLGILIGFSQIVFLEQLDSLGYVVYMPTAIAILMIWWGISLMGRQKRLVYG